MQRSEQADQYNRTIRELDHNIYSSKWDDIRDLLDQKLVRRDMLLCLSSDRKGRTATLIEMILEKGKHELVNQIRAAQLLDDDEIAEYLFTQHEKQTAHPFAVLIENIDDPGSMALLSYYVQSGKLTSQQLAIKFAGKLDGRYTTEVNSLSYLVLQIFKNRANARKLLLNLFQSGPSRDVNLISGNLIDSIRRNTITILLGSQVWKWEDRHPDNAPIIFALQMILRLHNETELFEKGLDRACPAFVTFGKRIIDEVDKLIARDLSVEHIRVNDVLPPSAAIIADLEFVERYINDYLFKKRKEVFKKSIIENFANQVASRIENIVLAQQGGYKQLTDAVSDALHVMLSRAYTCYLKTHPTAVAQTQRLDIQELIAQHIVKSVAQLSKVNIASIISIISHVVAVTPAAVSLPDAPISTPSETASQESKREEKYTPALTPNDIVQKYFSAGSVKLEPSDGVIPAKHVALFVHIFETLQGRAPAFSQKDRDVILSFDASILKLLDSMIQPRIMTEAVGNVNSDRLVENVLPYCVEKIKPFLCENEIKSYIKKHLLPRAQQAKHDQSIEKFAEFIVKCYIDDITLSDESDLGNSAAARESAKYLNKILISGITAYLQNNPNANISHAMQIEIARDIVIRKDILNATTVAGIIEAVVARNALEATYLRKDAVDESLPKLATLGTVAMLFRQSKQLLDQVALLRQPDGTAHLSATKPKL